ncbi:aminoglycoside N(3)-acetyltransferase [Dyella terrae]|uniref:aminoglycoside N(3)-acetyltransferase n=1 Tax=Dyella terrae TaxID=522259 RepID=UPI001EFEA5B6|nr:AAC(3) family N-acetyltransferase [Dyella terrae]ULU25830.1 AAC(3) family N-acetyltransferase [Dyella terrae]
MRNQPHPPVDTAFLQQALEDFGVPRGGVVIVHSSLSAFGNVIGGGAAVVEALLGCMGDAGTLVVPTFTPQISDPHPHDGEASSLPGDSLGSHVPLFHRTTPTLMGAVPNAVLADARHRRSFHPQASVAAIGPHAETITADHPLAYALGKQSPFERLYELGAHILLLGVGHNRNTFLHYAESLTPRHRTKRRRFPYENASEGVWMEVPDVGDDNGRFFPQVGADADAAGLIRHRSIASAPCQLMASGPFVDFATTRLDALLADAKKVALR